MLTCDFELLETFVFSVSGLHRTSRNRRTTRTGGRESEFKCTIIQSSFQIHCENQADDICMN